MGWSGKAGDSFELKYQCPDIPDVRFVKSSRLHHFTWMSKAAVCIRWTLAGKKQLFNIFLNYADYFYFSAPLNLSSSLIIIPLRNLPPDRTPLKFVFLPVRCRCLAASLFSCLCNLFPWKYKRKFHPDFTRSMKSEGYLADSWLHWIFCPCVKKKIDFIKMGTLLQSSSYWWCFERVLRCVVFQLAACMLCVCLCTSHVDTAVAASLCVWGARLEKQDVSTALMRKLRVKSDCLNTGIGCYYRHF